MALALTQLYVCTLVVQTTGELHSQKLTTASYLICYTSPFHPASKKLWVWAGCAHCTAPTQLAISLPGKINI